MEVFPLRPSAYLCVLCVNRPFNAEGRRDTQRPQRNNQICHFLCKAAATALRTNNPRFLQKFVSIRIHGFVQESKIYNVLQLSAFALSTF